MKAVLDIETGGFSITKNGICEIGILALDKDLNEVDRLHVYIIPYTRADDTLELVSYKEDAMRINGLNVDFLHKAGIPVETASNMIVKFFEKYNFKSLLGHNVGFDLPRVNYLLARFAHSVIPRLEIIDTLDIARASKRFAKNDLEFLCKELEIDNKDKHTAIGDCFSTIELYKKLVQEKIIYFF